MNKRSAILKKKKRFMGCYRENLRQKKKMKIRFSGMLRIKGN